MKSQTLKKAIKHWNYIAPLVIYPKNNKEFDKLVMHLDDLLEIVGNNEKHPLIGLVNIMDQLISSYEEEHYQNLTEKGIDALKFLMDLHQLHQSDLAEIASQGVISEILNGKRALNVRQIKLLAKRFKVTPATFIDDIV